MGSSNGVTRGQLRPYFSGRTPPFILVGTLIVLIIFGFSYWSLNTQYGDLQIEVHEFQDQLRIAAQKRLDLEKQVHTFQEQLINAQESLTKSQDALQKKEDEVTDLSEQVRDASKFQSQLESKKIDLDRCQDEKARNDGECSMQKDVSNQLQAENGELKTAKDELQHRLNTMENEMKQIEIQLMQYEKKAKVEPPKEKSQTKSENTIKPNQIEHDKPIQDKPIQDKASEEPSGNPDEGPLQSNDVNNDNGQSTVVDDTHLIKGEDLNNIKPVLPEPNNALGNNLPVKETNGVKDADIAKP